MKVYPVSIIICALNEQKRIKDTIDSARRNNPVEIIVVEGGSTDATFSIAKAHADRAYSVDIFGLGYKRAFGVTQATQKYILTLDADQVLEVDSLPVMIGELEEHGFAGIQASLKSIKNETYWERAMGYNVGLTHSRPRQTNMIGTPALFRTDILKKNNFDKTISGSCDDTDLCYRLSKQGYRLGISTAICYQKHRSSPGAVMKKFLWYGEGDFEFGLKHPERLFSIFTHPIKNYVFRRSASCMKNGDYFFIPFFVLSGLVRHCGFYRALAKKVAGNGLDSRVQNRTDLNY